MIRILTGNVFDVLPTLPDRSVQSCITSPPYWGLRDYGVPGQLGLEKTPQEYVTNLVAVFREVRRVLRDDGVLWLNLGDSFASGKGTCYNPGGGENSLGQERKAAGAHPLDRGNKSTLSAVGLKPKDLVGIPWRVAFALQDDGWWLRSDIIWSKPNPMPESVTDRPTKAHEYIFLLAKSQRYYWDQEAVREPIKPGNNGHIRGRARTANGALGGENQHHMEDRHYAEIKGAQIRTVWTIATHPYSGAHFATFPPALVEPMVKASTSERGCCPKCGKPWERVVERKPSNPWQERVAAGAKSGSLERGHNENHGEGMSHDLYVNTTTLSWRPGCSCDAGEPVPCVVLDCFGGAGTTGLVASRLGRDAVLIELNPEYAEMARRRIYEDAPLLNRGAK